MKRRTQRKRSPRLPLIAAGLLCAGLLVACAVSSSTSLVEPLLPSSEIPASSAVIESTLPSSEAMPSGEEVVLAPLTDPSEALETCLGWGPGTAGSSLKSVSAAAALMEWAEENSLAQREADEVTGCLQDWFDQLEPIEQDNLSESWPLVCEAAQQMWENPLEMTNTMEDAGVDPDALPASDSPDWEILQTALDQVVPAPMQ